LAVAIARTAKERAETLAAAPTVVSVQGVSKTFRLPRNYILTLKERVLHPFTRQEYDLLHALNDVSFEVPRGEFIGIVGRNGSGKSTLLKCMAGIYDIDQGDIQVSGRLSPFIELGVGFNPDLTARDNVLINAIMLGLTRKQAAERFDDIVRFAELEDFLDLKLKNYSSGMHVRLAFSTAVQVDADVLLVDEVLAVGDASFQQKCFEQFQNMKDTGRTIVFVTHDMSSVERFCDRAILIEQGNVVAIGEPSTVTRKYNELNFGRTAASADAAQDMDSGGERWGDHRVAEIRAAWFEDGQGERVVTLGHGETARVCVEVYFHEEVGDPTFGIMLRNDAHHTIFVAGSQWEMGPTGRFAAGETVVVSVQFQNWLAPSRYTLTPSIARAGVGADTLDMREDLVSLVVHGTRSTGGVADLPHDFDVERL